MIVTKAIGPARFRQEKFRTLVQAEAEKTARDIEADFKKTTATWKHKVSFERIVGVGPSSVDILVDTDDEIYRFVSEGTRPHPIFPVRAKALRFQGTYSAKTTPGVIGSKGGGASGDVVYRPYVEHPGSEPRNFGPTIAKIWSPRFRRRMEAVMSQFRKESGHAI